MLYGISLVVLGAVALLTLFVFVLMKVFSLPRSFYENERKRKQIRVQQIEFERDLKSVREEYGGKQPENKKRN
jgi:uncharacterized protein HemY